MTIAILIAAMLQQAPVVASPVRDAPPVAAQAPDVDLAAIMRRGRLLYLLDQAAWHSTDALLKDVRDPGAAGVRGWIVEPDGDAMRVTYYGVDGTRPVPIYVASFRKGKVRDARLIPPAERRPLHADQQRLVTARSAVNQGGLGRCVPQPFNTIVIPPASAGTPVDVYLLTPQTKVGAWPIGKHYRRRIGDNRELVEQREFTKSCLVMDTAGMPKGGTPVSFFITHLLDSVPTEIHVFTALASRVPLMVQTRDTLWQVDGETIRRVAAPDPGSRAR